MNLAAIILASITLLIQKYADYDKEEDYKITLSELKQDLNLPRIKTYDFIVGKDLLSISATAIIQNFKSH